MSGRLIVVESNTTGTGMLLLHVAAALGLRPVFVTNAPARYRGLAEAPAQIELCDTNSAAALERMVDRFRAEIRGVTTTSEFYLPAAADLAARLALPGNPPSSARVCRDKAKVRARLAAAGIGQPRFAAIDALTGVSGAVRRVGLPCVVKPVDGSGSQDVRLCVTEDEVSEHVESLLAVEVNMRGQPVSGTVLIESYVDGPEYSVEMFGTAGRTVCVGVTAKVVDGRPWFVERGHLYPAPLEGATASAVTDHVRRVLAALGVTHGPSHTEVRVAAGEVLVIEVNARLAGGMIPRLVQLADRVDLLEQQVRVAAGLPVRLAHDRRGYAGIRFLTAPAAGVVRAVRGTDTARAVPGVEDVGVTAAPGMTVAPARSAYERIGHVIARGPSPSAVTEALRRATEEIELTISPTRRPTT